LKEDPWEAINAQKALKHEEDRRRKQDFLHHWLTRAEREVALSRTVLVAEFAQSFVAQPTTRAGELQHPLAPKE
jgi:hypothetical protein